MPQVLVHIPYVRPDLALDLGQHPPQTPLRKLRDMCYVHLERELGDYWYGLMGDPSACISNNPSAAGPEPVSHHFWCENASGERHILPFGQEPYLEVLSRVPSTNSGTVELFLEMDVYCVRYGRAGPREYVFNPERSVKSALSFVVPRMIGSDGSCAETCWELVHPQRRLALDGHHTLLAQDLPPGEVWLNRSGNTRRLMWGLMAAAIMCGAALGISAWGMGSP